MAWTFLGRVNLKEDPLFERCDTSTNCCINCNCWNNLKGWHFSEARELWVCEYKKVYISKKVSFMGSPEWPLKWENESWEIGLLCHGRMGRIKLIHRDWIKVMNSFKRSFFKLKFPIKSSFINAVFQLLTVFAVAFVLVNQTHYMTVLWNLVKQVALIFIAMEFSD